MPDFLNGVADLLGAPAISKGMAAALHEAELAASCEAAGAEPGGQWMIVVEGLVSHHPRYEIEFARMADTTTRHGVKLYDWPVHLAEKEWVDMQDFVRVFGRAFAFLGSKYGCDLKLSRLLQSVAHAYQYRETANIPWTGRR